MHSKALIFPQEILDQHLVVLGKTGAGKSSALRHIVEHLLSKKKRACIVDPKGDWWGLKSSADGRGAGFPVILFGDFKNEKATDVPINAQSGNHIAELIATGNRPCVIGMRGWTQGAMTRFWIDFASTFFTRNAGEFYLVGDEFHNFAPKQWKGIQDKDNPAAVGLHWANRLLSEGRGLGLVCLIASQRPQKVHNDTLTSCETLVAMRVIHAADRSAVEDWIKGAGDPTLGKEVLNSLAKMPRGEAFVWSPEVQFGPQRLTFPMFTTFDSFAPPQLQKKVSEKGWADVDLTEVREKLAAVIEQAQADDPKVLKKRVRELTAEVERLQRDLLRAVTEVATKTETIEVPVLPDEMRQRLEVFAGSFGRGREDITQAARQLGEYVERLGDFVNEIKTALQPLNSPKPAPPQKQVIKLPAAEGKRPAPLPAQSNSDISRPQQKILDALAWFETVGINAPSRTNVAAMAGCSPRSSGFEKNISTLRAQLGLINYPSDGCLALTSEGRATARHPQSPGSLDDLHQAWLRSSALSGPQREMLQVLIGNYPDALSRDELAESLDRSAASSGFEKNVSTLSGLGLVSYPQPGYVVATDLLFPPGLD